MPQLRSNAFSGTKNSQRTAFPGHYKSRSTSFPKHKKKERWEPQRTWQKRPIRNHRRTNKDLQQRNSLGTVSRKAIKGWAFEVYISRKNIYFLMATLWALHTKADTGANSVDPDETARNEPSHLDLHCLPFPILSLLFLPFYFFFYFYLRDIPYWDNGHIQFHRRQSPLQKIGWKSSLSVYCYIFFF